MLRKNDDIPINTTPGPRDSPHRIGSGSGTRPLDYESRDPVLDPETLPFKKAIFILQHPLTSIMCSCAVSARIKARF